MSHFSSFLLYSYLILSTNDLNQNSQAFWIFDPQKTKKAKKRSFLNLLCLHLFFDKCMKTSY